MDSHGKTTFKLTYWQNSIWESAGSDARSSSLETDSLPLKGWGGGGGGGGEACSGRDRQTDAPPLKGRDRQTDAPPLKGRDRQTDAPPLKGRDRQTDAPPLKGRDRQTDAPPLKGRDRQTDAPPLKGRDRQTDAPPLKGRDRQTDAPPLKGRDRQTDAPPLKGRGGEACSGRDRQTSLPDGEEECFRDLGTCSFPTSTTKTAGKAHINTVTPVTYFQRWPSGKASASRTADSGIDPRSPRTDRTSDGSDQ